MKPHILVIIIVVCALAATWASVGRKPKMLRLNPVAKQRITSSQQFKDFYGLDAFTFKKEAYFVLINEKEAALYKLDVSRLELVAANLFPTSQKLIQYKVDSKDRLALVLEEKGELIVELLDKSNRIEIKLGKLEHKNIGHSLCCADVLSEQDGLYVWHERRLLKFDIAKNPPKKVFNQQMNFETSDKGNLLTANGRVYLNMHDGENHFFNLNDPVFHSEKDSGSPLVADAPCDGSASMVWDHNWPESYLSVDKVLNLGRPVILSKKQGIYYLDEFNYWSKITSHVDAFIDSESYALKDGKILFVGHRKDEDGKKSIRHLTIFDTINKTYDILTLELG